MSSCASPSDTPGIVAASPRVYGGGLISSGSETVAGILVGVDPDHEVEVTRLLADPGRRVALRESG